MSYHTPWSDTVSETDDIRTETRKGSAGAPKRQERGRSRAEDAGPPPDLRERARARQNAASERRRPAGPPRPDAASDALADEAPNPPDVDETPCPDPLPE